MKKLLVIVLLLSGSILFSNCGGGNEGGESSATTEQSASGNSQQENAEEIDPMSLKGVGPVTSIEIPETIDEELAKKGEELFSSKGCNACHEIEERKVGPPLKGITTRRTPEWIMNMILNPTEMTQKDPLARKLLAEYASPMSNQNLTEEEARALLEYFRKIDSQQ